MNTNDFSDHVKKQDQLSDGRIPLTSINTQEHFIKTTIHTSPMTNGAIVYAPMSPSVSYHNNQDGTTTSVIESTLLHQIIANDVHLQNHRKITDNNLDSRSTVVRKVPDGGVQITYRKMVNNVHTKGNSLPYILPKPSNKTQQPINGLYNNTQPINGLYKNSEPINGLYKNTQPINGLYKNTHMTSPNIFPNGLVYSGYIPHSNGLIVCTANPMLATTIDNKTSNYSGTLHTIPLTFPKMKTNVASSCFNSAMTTPPLVNSPCKESTTVTSSPRHHMNPCSTGLTDDFSSQHDFDNLLNSDFNRIGTIDMEIDCLNPENDAESTSLYDSELFRDFISENPLISVSNSFSTTNVASNFTSTDSAISSVSLGTGLSNHLIDNITQPHALTVAETTISIPNMRTEPEPSFTSQTNNSLLKISNNNFQNFNPESDLTELIEIIDVSPEISTTSGGNKIILIGSWNAKEARYTCKFDENIVDACLIQNGVLRCYSPAHRPGKVKLSVLRNNIRISKVVDFEFVDPSIDTENEMEDDEIITHDQWMSISNESLLQMLEERMSAIIEMMGMSNVLENLPSNISNSEEKLVLICKQLIDVNVSFHFDYQVEKSMTVLHLAAALGYIKLIQLLLNWVESNPHKLIRAEACPTHKDQFHLLPIMWSAARGHFNTTCVLHQWDENTLEVQDTCGCTVIELAKESGHTSLVSYLDRILKKSSSTKEPYTFDTSINSPHCGPSSVTSQSKSSDHNDGMRTLGKTLAHIQSIISEEHDESSVDICSDGEESIFEASFTPRKLAAKVLKVTLSGIATARLNKLPFPPYKVAVNFVRRSDESRVAVTSMTQHSPSSPGQNSLQSPFNRQMCETAEFCEFFFKAKTIEKDFAELTLTDEEQEDLYKAANVIQTAYKSYKDRRKQRDTEFSAATLIQSYYRRYKQYAAFKKMQKGAVLIQNQYRAHREKARRKSSAAQVIQSYYRRYRERKLGVGNDTTSYQQKNRALHQVERKNNRFRHQSTKRFSREFVESFINQEYVKSTSST